MKRMDISGAETILNDDGEVALTLAPLPHRPTSWKDMGGGVVALFAGGKEIAAFGCSPDSYAAMVSKGRVLVVESQGGVLCREVWVARSA